MFVQARSLALSIRLAEFRAEWLDLPKQDDNPLLSVPWRRRCAPRKHHCGLRNHEPRSRPDRLQSLFERQLGRKDFVFGQFGENFTVEGLSDEEVCIGDRYRIGSALLEVTQPRVTCYRVGIRMDEPRMAAMPELPPMTTTVWQTCVY
jgi:hypothetical protein